jgi:hypothetical protein
MLGSKPGLLRLRHWQSDALTTWLTVFSARWYPAPAFFSVRWALDSAPIVNGQLCRCSNADFGLQGRRLPMVSSKIDTLRSWRRLHYFKLNRLYPIPLRYKNLCSKIISMQIWEHIILFYFIITSHDLKTLSLKVHKIENFFGSNFEFCVISLLVMLKY